MFFNFTNLNQKLLLQKIRNLMKFGIVFLFLFLTRVAAHPEFPEKTNVTDPSFFPFKGEIFTGFIQVDNTTRSNLFYQLYGFNNGSILQKAPLIVWLQGGPGSSSNFGNYGEIGPFEVIASNDTLGPNYSFTPRNTTWNKLAHLLFIDQPIGTGFSNAFQNDYVKTTYEAAEHFQIFLARFYQLFPNFIGEDLYFVGESYAGHWVPYFANYILSNASNSYINLRGVAIGNAWVDPPHQTAVYSTFCYAAGLLTQKERDYFKVIEAKSLIAMYQGDYDYANDLANFLLDYVTEKRGISMFNYRLFVQSAQDDYAGNGYDKWLNTTEAQKRLGVPYPYNYSDGSDEVFNALNADGAVSVLDAFRQVLAKLKVLIFVGVDDENVNYEGHVHFMRFLEWEKAEEFERQPKKAWTVNNRVGGFVKSVENLSFVTVLGAGHILPVDQPDRGFDMMKRFLNDLQFD